MKPQVIFSTILLIFFIYSTLGEASIIEFDEKFPTSSKQGNWLVMFYAPWCGHCKHLEPTWKELSQAMQVLHPDINVGRLDCTKYSNIATLYGVRGFPTIKFIRDGISHDYKGPRSTSNLMNFVERVSGPIITKLDSEESLKEQILKNEVLFVFIGTDVDVFWKIFLEAAKTLYTEISFFSIHPNLVEKMKLKTSSLVVFKDKDLFYLPSDVKSFTEVLLWIKAESIPNFPMLEGKNFAKLKSAGRKLAIIASDVEGSQLNESVSKLAASRSEKFTFCWTLGAEVINSLTYSTISTPNLVIYDPLKQNYYLLRDHTEKDSVEDIKEFLLNIKDGKIKPIGGFSVWQQTKRAFLDLLFSFFDFFKTSPILASVIIVIPTIFISFLCICICTMTDDVEDVDESDYDSELDEDLPDYVDEESPPDVDPASVVRRRVVQNSEE